MTVTVQKILNDLILLLSSDIKLLEERYGIKINLEVLDIDLVYELLKPKLKSNRNPYGFNTSRICIREQNDKSIDDQVEQELQEMMLYVQENIKEGVDVEVKKIDTKTKEINIETKTINHENIKKVKKVNKKLTAFSIPVILEQPIIFDQHKLNNNYSRHILPPPEPGIKLSPKELESEQYVQNAKNYTALLKAKLKESLATHNFPSKQMFDDASQHAVDHLYKKLIDTQGSQSYANRFYAFFTGIRNHFKANYATKYEILFHPLSNHCKKIADKIPNRIEQDIAIITNIYATAYDIFNNINVADNPFSPTDINSVRARNNKERNAS